MHIPDGFLSARTAAAAAVLSAGALGVALNVARSLPRRRVPLMGLTAAFIFAAQMINFPIAAGTSGHLVGAVLAAVLVGPAAAVVVMSAVLIVQCVLLGDGGLTALGANIFNMAVAAPVFGYAVYGLISRLLPGTRGRIVAAAFAGWCATVIAALCCAVELAFSGIHWVVFPAMINVHLLIGIGEATLTALILSAIIRTRPELLDASAAEPARRRMIPLVVAGLLVAIALAVFISPLGSDWPDGLEKVAEHFGFAASSRTVLPPALGLDSKIRTTAWATALASAVGTVLAFGLSLLLARWLVPNRSAGRNGEHP